MSREIGRASVSLTSRRTSHLRLRQQLPRLLLCLVAAAGLIASARFAIAPPRAERSLKLVVPTPDVAAEGFAVLFAHSYLSWQERDPEARRTALEPFIGSALAPEAGVQLPMRGSQRVLFEQVVAEREGPPGLHAYSIAADTDPGGLVYLSVSVLQQPDGSLALAGYPAFVGPPASAPVDPIITSGPEVEDPGLRTVVQRALRNYLAPSPDELAADLAPGASITPPPQGLTLEGLQSLTWAPGIRAAVVAQVLAAAPDGVRFTLAYELQTTRTAGRWEIAAIQDDGGA